MRAFFSTIACLLVACASGSRPPGDAATSTDAGSGCPGAQILCDGECVSPRTDRRHCGGCDDGSGAFVCSAGEICSEGACELSCGGATPLRCGDRCVDPGSDPAHCGACDSICDAAEECIDAACSPICSAPASTLCGTACVDTTSDAAHCGACGAACTDLDCAGSRCVPRCPAGEIRCEGACIDPSTDAAHCGASGACTGGSAGTECGSDERCVEGTCRVPPPPASCRDALERGLSVGDGVYTVDPSSGGAAPFAVYCDMSTDGGGWTLTFKLRNDVLSTNNPWWNMVLPGSGSSFPTTTDVPSTTVEGPIAAVRESYVVSTGATEWRASTRRAGTIVFDLASSYAGANGRGLRCFASGTCSTADQTCSPGFTDGRVLATSLGGAIGVGGTGYVCDVGWTDCSFCVDWSEVRIDTTAGGSTANAVRYAGDSAIALTDTITLYWVR